MSKDKIADYDGSTAGNNTDIGGISIAEGMLPSAVNNSMRELTKQLGAFANGTDAIDALAVDNLKLDGNTISSTDANGNVTIDPAGTGDTIVGSGNFLVGTTNTLPAINNVEGIALSAGSYGGRLEVSRDGNEAVSINRKSNDGSLMSFKKDGSTIATIGVDGGDNLFITGETGNTGGIYMNDAAVSPAYQGAERDNHYDLGKAPARWKNLYLSGGAYIGGTGSANYLNDYEVGTFTPTLLGSSSNPTVSYAAQIGKYTKIGNSVIVDIYLQTNSSSGGSGNLRIAGLPFTAVSGGAESGAAPIGYNVNTGEEARVIANNNGTFCQMLVRGGRTTSYGWANQAISAWSNSNPTALTVSFAYKTS